MSWLFPSSKTQNEPPNATSTIEKLCDRARDATLLEDRRSAVQGLRGLARDWQLEVGTNGMPALVKVLRNDRMDIEIVKLALETLGMLFDNSNKKEGAEDMGVMMTEIFVKDASNVVLLLDILAESDFYVRFNCVQLLTTLCTNTGSALREGILTSPVGISRLIDLLDDRREIVRNDGLLLLINLTENNADIQKIVAFENAFERLFVIILQEGAVEGGIIVQDCLQLMHNLLKYNSSNQNLFRETNCIKQVPKLFTCRRDDPRKGLLVIPLTDSSINWIEQRIKNAKIVLDLIRILVIGKNQNTNINQNLLANSDMISILFETAMNVNVPFSVKEDAFLALGDLMQDNDINREKFAKCSASITIIPENNGLPSQRSPPGAPASSSDAILRFILDKQPYRIRMCVLYMFKSYMSGNSEAQIAVATSLHPTKGTASGKILADSIIDLNSSRKDPLRTWFACAILQHTLYNNEKAKEFALCAIYTEHGETISLLNKICFTLICASRDGMDINIIIGILMLLCVWLFENTSAVKEFLGEGANMQFLIEQITQSSGTDPVVQGLSAFIYSIVYQFNDDSEPSFKRKSLKDLILTRVGPDVFHSRIHRFKESKMYIGSDKLNFQEPDIVFDITFLEFLRSHMEFLSKLVTAPKSAKSDTHPPDIDPEVVAELKSKVANLNRLLSEKDYELETLRNIAAQLEQQLRNPAKSPDHSTISELQNQLTEKDLKLREMETDQEDLLLCLADQELEIKNLKIRLTKYGEIFTSDSDADSQ